MKTHLLIILVLIGGITNSFGQPKNRIDSLLQVIRNGKQDTSVCQAYCELGQLIHETNPDSAFAMWEKSAKLCTRFSRQNQSIKLQEKFKWILAGNLTNLGVFYKLKGDYATSLDFLIRALRLNEELGDKRDLANNIEIIGSTYYSQNEFELSTTYFIRAVNIYEELNDKKELAENFTNIGYVYDAQQEYEKSIEYYQQSLDNWVELNDSAAMVVSLNDIASAYDKIRAVNKSLDFYFKSIKIAEKLGDSLGTADILSSIGVVYENLGKITDCLKSYNGAINIYEALGNKAGVAETYNYLGVIYGNQGELQTALEFLNRGLDLYQEIGDKTGMAETLNNIGYTYNGEKEFGEALKHQLRSLQLYEELGDMQGVALILNNIGYNYTHSGDGVKGLEYYNRSLQIYEKFDHKPGIAISLSNIGNIYFDFGNFDKAKEMGERSLLIANSLKSPYRIEAASGLLGKVYVHDNNWKSAYKMYKLSRLMFDSIRNDETEKASLKQNMQYDYEKQKAVDNAENDKLLALEQEEKEKQKIISYGISGGLVLVVFFLMFIFNRLKITKKQRDAIEIQKVEIGRQKDIVETAHRRLEEKNSEILDSINYARRIQSAILPPKKLVKEYLENSFILYKPKDIIAGDFYWIERGTGPNDKSIFFAAADCTGHGVPGAMMSVMCSNALTKCVKELGLTTPAQVLDETARIVASRFERSEEQVQDGMDIALCMLSLNSRKVQFSGAYNPLWIIRKGELLETKADKQPIGQYEYRKPFTNNTIDLEIGDVLYIFSDGFVDQFGGERGKKFKSKAFKLLLMGMQDKSMEEQRIELDEIFENWKGNLEQVDDVCVIGVRV